jgi:hypothetical protein
MKKVWLFLSLCLLAVAASGQVAGPFALIGEWQLFGKSGGTTPMGTLQATTTVMEIKLQKHPGEVYLIDYVVSDTGNITGKLQRDPLITIQGQLLQPDEFVINAGIQNPGQAARGSTPIFNHKARRLTAE